MARTKTTYDVFSAIGEPKRRTLIEHLAENAMTVNELVEKTQWPQPTVSKHLRVLRQVRIVKERQVGRCRIYTIQAEELRPIQEWMHRFEKFWGGTLEQLEEYLNQIQEKG